MSSGILAIARGVTLINTINNSAVVYTVPSGISHQVVHLEWSGSYSALSAYAELRINGEPYFKCGDFNGVDPNPSPTSASLVLSPGDVISIAIVSSTPPPPFDNFRYNFIISGYSVP